MQIFQNLWRVIFMLSTIVYVTDCCSSRILLLKDHTMKLVRHAQPQQHHHSQHHHQIYEHDSSSLQLQQKLPQHVDIVTSTVREYNKNFSSEIHSQQERKEKEADDDNSTTESIEMAQTTEYAENNDKNYTDTTTDFESGAAMERTVVINTTEYSISKINVTNTDNNTTATFSNTSDFITDPAIREQHAGNPKYHAIDFVYIIMRDVLSFECYGQFLTDFCLNRGRCFRFPVGNDSFFSCECADGYVGERCESKSVDELYVPSSSIVVKDSQQPKILMARFFISFPMLIVFSVIYLIIAALVVFRKPKNRATGMLVS